MKLLSLLGCAALMAAGTGAAESSWFAAEDAVPTALLPQPSAMPRLSEGGAVVATRTPEAYVVLSGAAGECLYPTAPARPAPDGSIVLADVANDGAAPVELSIGFRVKGGGGFGWKASLPPGRRTLELSPADCAPADGWVSLPSNRWSGVSGLALGVRSANEGTAARIVLRDLSVVEARLMRSRGGQPWPEERELLPADRAPFVFASRPGEFKGKPDARSVRFPVDGQRLFDGVAFHGTSGRLVLTVRATDPQTRAVEIGFRQSDGRVWGSAGLAIGSDWQEVVLPFKRMRYFSHWGLPAIPPDAKPEPAKFTAVHFCFGKWLCADTLDLPHGFEVKSIKIVQ